MARVSTAEEMKPNWFISTLAKVTNLPVIRHLLTELSRPGYMVGNLVEGDIKNAYTVMLPFSEIDADEATSVSDVLLPKGAHWSAKLALDIITDPTTYIAVGGAGKLSARLAGITTKGEFARRATKLVEKATYAGITDFKNLAEFKHLAKIAKKAGVQLIEDGRVIRFGETFAEQARLGNRALITWGGKGAVKGEKALDLLSGMSAWTQDTKAFKMFETAFGTVKSSAQKTADLLFAGKKAHLTHQVDRQLKAFKGIIDGLPEDSQKRVHTTWEKLDIDGKIPPGVRLDQKEVAAVRAGQELLDTWKSWYKEAGIELPTLRGSLEKQVAKLAGERDKIIRKIARDTVNEWGPLFKRMQSSVNAIKKALPDDAREAVELGNAMIMELRKDIRKLILSKQGARSLRAAARAHGVKLSDEKLALAMLEQIDNLAAKGRLAPVEVDIIDQVTAQVKKFAEDSTQNADDIRAARRMLDRFNELQGDTPMQRRPLSDDHLQQVLSSEDTERVARILKDISPPHEESVSQFIKEELVRVAARPDIDPKVGALANRAVNRIQELMAKNPKMTSIDLDLLLRKDRRVIKVANDLNKLLPPDVAMDAMPLFTKHYQLRGTRRAMLRGARMREMVAELEGIGVLGSHVKDMQKLDIGLLNEIVGDLRNLDKKQLNAMLGVADANKFMATAAQIQLISDAVIDKVPHLKAAANALRNEGTTLSARQVLQAMKTQDIMDFVDELPHGAAVPKSMGETQLEKLAMLERQIAETEKAISMSPAYLPHVLTPEALREVAKNAGFRTKLARADVARGIMRRFREGIEDGLPGRTLTIDEINALALEPEKLSEGTARKVAIALQPKNEKETKRLFDLMERGEITSMKDAIEKGYADNVAKYFETDVRVIMETVGREMVNTLSSIDYMRGSARMFGRALKVPEIKTVGQLRKRIQEYAAKEGADPDTLEALLAIDGKLGKVPGSRGIRKRLSQSEKKLVADTFGGGRSSDLPLETFDEIPLDWVEPFPNDKHLKGVYFRRDIANQVIGTHEKLFNPVIFNDFLKAYDKVQNLWKLSATALNIAFHGRNFLSNKFLNWMAGMNPADPAFVRSYRKAMQLQAYSRDTVKYADELAKLRFDVLGGSPTTGLPYMDGNEFLEVAFNSRALDSATFFAAELPKGNSSKLVDNALVKLGRKGFDKVEEVSRGLGSWIEDNDRLAHLIWKMEVEKLDAVTAGQSVLSTLFDYGNLTTIESDIFKRLMPFYTFSRRAIPSMLNAVARNPGKLMAMKRALLEPKTGIKVFGLGPIEQPLPDELLPNYITENFGIPVRLDEDGNPQYFILESWLPVFELNKLSMSPTRLWEETTQMLTPLIKAPLEWALNYSLFWKSEIERYEGETAQFLGFRLQKRNVLHFLKTVRTLNEIDNFIRTMPNTDDYRKRELLDSTMRFLFGVKLNEVDVKRRKASVEYQKKRTLGKLKSAYVRAEKIGDEKNMGILQNLISEIDLSFKPEENKLKGYEANLKALEKQAKAIGGPGLTTDGFNIADIIARSKELAP